jgi:hypothetical protein
MRRRALLLASCIAVPVALGALAQAEAERQLDAAIARLRAGLGPDGAVEWRGRSVDPVTGTARFQGLTIRQGSSRLTVQEAVLGDVREDRIGQASLNGLRIEAVARGPSGTAVVTAGRVTLNALAVPAAGSGPAVDWPAVAVEQAVAEGLRAEVQGRGDADLGRLTLSGYAPGRAREVVIEGLRLDDRHNRHNGATRILLGRARLAGAEFPRIGQRFDPWALAADDAVLEGAEVTVEKQNGRVRLGRAHLGNWREGQIASLAAEGLSVSGDTPDTGPFTAELGRLALSGIAARDTAYAIAHDLNPPQAAPGQEQAGEMEGLAVSQNGAPLLRLGSLRLRNSWEGAGTPVALGSLALDGLAVDLPAGYGGDWLANLGFKAILARIGVQTRLNSEEQRLVTDSFTIEATGMASLGLSMDVRGFEAPAPGQPSAANDDPLAVISQWSVAGFTIRYTEEGLVGALLARQAAREQVPEAQLRERYAQMVLRTPVPGANAGKEVAALRPIREALASFARDPGTIEISLRPPKPVPMLELAGIVGMPPEQAVRNLNLTVTAMPRR